MRQSNSAGSFEPWTASHQAGDAAVEDGDHRPAEIGERCEGRRVELDDVASVSAREVGDRFGRAGPSRLRSPASRSAAEPGIDESKAGDRGRCPGLLGRRRRAGRCEHGLVAEPEEARARSRLYCQVAPPGSAVMRMRSEGFMAGRDCGTEGRRRAGRGPNRRRRRCRLHSKGVSATLCLPAFTGENMGEREPGALDCACRVKPIRAAHVPPRRGCGDPFRAAAPCA